MPIKREMLVRRDALDQLAVNETLVSDPGAGEVLLQVEAIAITANTVTNGVVGETVGYWKFFPAPEGWGVVPAWGFARVVASRCAEIAVGERVYGFMPMASHLLVTPGKIGRGLFRDMAPHRQPMSAVYNQYRRLGAELPATPEREALRMLFEPLFLTSFLIEDALRRADHHGAQSVVLTSASSKTALAAAYVLRARSPGLTRIGLTAAANVGFVEGTGLYDSVLAYDAIDTLAPTGSSVLIDFAGDAAVLEAVYARLAGRIAHSLRVGVTHHDAATASALPLAPKPVWFFAPDAATTLIGEIGQDAFNVAVAAQWDGFVELAAGLVKVAEDSGIDALQRIWRLQVAGQAKPDTGYCIRF
ncbi:hypothetical protein GCM10008023_31460 [Sphingomonas glacialis]|uniref:DUF2855 family protein n=1 Tax=Sphingomonas glacialis TaxID=658225 RepID=A0ABQ3LP88_9SPHN|nr:DUF2855 family protein [Sphingomonas glacialis]GHH21986.1 hypothetical protein GCM10008023_31460 [Sphingomonas glacialis]